MEGKVVLEVCLLCKIDVGTVELDRLSTLQVCSSVRRGVFLLQRWRGVVGNTLGEIRLQGVSVVCLLVVLSPRCPVSDCREI